MTNGVNLEGIFPYIVGCFKSLINIPILDFPIDADVVGAVVVNDRSTFSQGRINVEYSRQFFVFHMDQVQCFPGGFHIHGRHGRHFIPDESHLVNGQRIFVLGVGEKAPVAVFHFRNIRTGYDTLDPGKRFCLAGINMHDPGVGHGTSQDKSKEHSRQLHVIGIYGGSPRLGQGIVSRYIFSHDTELFHWLFLSPQLFKARSRASRRALRVKTATIFFL